jgi:hypothetical protein
VEARMPQERLLYRTVGLAEMEGILATQSQAFPPRLAQQPLFYPVLTLQYAHQIAEQWNTGDATSGYAGFVTQFGVARDYLARFAEHTVGSAVHRELWIPAEELAAFNQHLRTPIQLIDAYYGDDYTGPIPHPFLLKNLAAKQQFPHLVGVFDYNVMDFMWEIRANAAVVALNYKYWAQHDYSAVGITSARKREILQAISHVWRTMFPTVPLVGSERAL